MSTDLIWAASVMSAPFDQQVQLCRLTLKFLLLLTHVPIGSHDDSFGGVELVSEMRLMFLRGKDGFASGLSNVSDS